MRDKDIRPAKEAYRLVRKDSERVQRSISLNLIAAELLSILTFRI